MNLKYNFWYWFDRLLFRKCWRVQSKHNCGYPVTYLRAYSSAIEAARARLNGYTADCTLIYAHTPIFTKIHEERLP
jgi:hypothetical protein